MSGAEDVQALAQAELNRRRSMMQQAPRETAIAPESEINLVSKAQEELDRRRLAQAELDRRRQQPGGVPPTGQPPVEEDNGLISNIGVGGKKGGEDVARQTFILGQLMSGKEPEGIPVAPAEELGFNRKSIGQFIGRAGVGGAPTLAAGITGGAAGAAAGSVVPVVGNVAGGLLGGAGAGGLMAKAQAFADAYNEARLAGKNHAEADAYASKVSNIAGGITALSAGLGGIGLKDTIIKQALKQIPIQGAAANVENIARNVVAKESGVDPERDILAGTKEATFGPGIMHTAQTLGTRAAIGAKNVAKKVIAPTSAEAPIGTKPVVESSTAIEPIVPKKVVEPQIESVEPKVGAKPKLRYDNETKTWKKVLTPEESTVLPAKKTNLSSEPEAVRKAADVNTDEVHQKIFGKPPEKPPGVLNRIVEGTKNIIKRNITQQGLFDIDAPIKKLEAKAGVKTPGEGPAYRAARFAKHVTGAIDAAFNYGRPYWDHKMNIMRVNQEAPGLTTIFKTVAKTPQMLKDFNTYAYAKRVKGQQLIEHGREQNIRPHEVEAAIGLEKKHPQFKQAFEEIQEYNHALLDMLEDTNLISPERKQALLDNGDYVPFYRELGEALGVDNLKSANRLSGQKAKIKPLKGEKKMYRVTDAQGDEIGRFPTHIDAEAAANNYNAQVAEEHAGHATKSIVENLYRNVGNFIPAAMRNAAAVETMKLATRTGVARPVTKEKGSKITGGLRDNVVAIMEKGKVKHYEITDPQLYTTLKTNLGEGKKPGLLRTAGRAMKSLYSAAIITNPKIAIGIAAKDIIQSGMVGKYSMGNIKGILYDLPKELVKAYSHEFAGKIDPRQVDVAAMGADSRFFRNNPEVKMREMERIIAKHNGKIVPHDWYNFPDKIRTFMDRLLTPAETANRMRKFEAARKKGKDIATAGYEALDYMDYQKQGSGEFAQYLRDFVPFAGSHLSSSHTLGTEIGHNKFRNLTTAKIMGVAAVSGYNAIINLDETNDPDPSNGYMSLPDYVRDNNWCFDLYKILPDGAQRYENGDTRWLLVPKPWEIGQLGGSVIENLMAVYKGEEDWGDVSKFLKNSFMDYLTINPVGAPLIKTGIEEFANKTFFGSIPIVPKQAEGLAPELQYNSKTSETAKKIGAVINKSPARVEHVANGIFGSLAEYCFSLGDVFIRDHTRGEKPEKNTSEKYIFNKFIKGTPLERTSYENEMYELYGATQEAYNTLKKYEKLGQGEKAEKYAEKNQELLSKYGYADNIRAAVKEVNDEMTKVREAPDLTGKEKQEAIKGLMRQKNQILYQMHQQLKEERAAKKKKD